MKEKLIDMHTVTKKKNKKNIFIPIFLGIFLFLILISGVFYGYSYAYKDKIYPGVKIAGYDVGGLSKENAQKVVKNKINKLEAIGMEIKMADLEEKNLSYQEAGIVFDKESSVEKAFNYARSENFCNKYIKLFKALIYGKNSQLLIKVDDSLLSQKIISIFEDNFHETKDASFKVVKNELIIVNEQFGQMPDIEQIKNNIIKLINSDNISNPISIVTKKTEPEITNNDIANLASEIKRLIDKKIIYQDNYQYYSPLAEDISSWLKIEKINAKSTIEINNEEINKYIEYLATNVDVLAIDKKTEENTGKVIQEGNDGKQLNREKAIQETKKALNSLEEKINIILDTTITLRNEIKVKQNNGGNPGLSSGKYIEVNLSNQVLYAYEGENQIASYSVSTGAWDYPTPIGTRTILDKSLKPFSQQYGLYMPFWNGLGGGYGIHELPEWPNGYKEGEDHLGTPVSHGCIRLGVGAAEMIYYWAPIGTPVYIHY